MTNQNLKIRIDIDDILNIDKRRKKYNNATLQGKRALEFIKKLSKNFTIILHTSKNEILTAKWLIDNDADSLVPYLANKEETFVIYINAKCLASCKDFDKFYNAINNFRNP